MTDDSETLYRINVKTPVSPDELASFTDLLESAGYVVVTDLKSGTLELREGDE